MKISSFGLYSASYPTLVSTHSNPTLPCCDTIWIHLVYACYAPYHLYTTMHNNCPHGHHSPYKSSPRPPPHHAKHVTAKCYIRFYIPRRTIMEFDKHVLWSSYWIYLCHLHLGPNFSFCGLTMHRRRLVESAQSSAFCGPAHCALSGSTQPTYSPSHILRVLIL